MIRHAILAIVLNSLVLYGVTVYFPNYLIITGGLLAFLIPATLFGLLNAILKPLLKLISLPLMVLSAGFFSLVINAAILYLLEFLVTIFSSFEISFNVQGGVAGYFVTAFILAILDSVVHWLIKKS